MRKDVFRKGIVLGIIVLFFGAGVVPSVSSNNSSYQSTIYVDDDAPPDWYDATHVQTIQEGIDNATAGDTVFVYSGTYYENVKINKSSITLEGENRNSVIINGGATDDVIGIQGSLDLGFENIRIIELTIENGDEYGIYAPYTDDVEISKCIIKNCIYGIRFWHTTGGSIYQNIISDNVYGIYLEFADHLTISRNCIHNNSRGILTDTSDSIEISYNDIRHCDNYGIIIGRDVDPKDKNHIHHNNFIDSKAHATFKKMSFEGPKTVWNDNYWDQLLSILFGIHIIRGIWEFSRFGLTIPWIQIDWRCPKEPYEIECN